MGSLSFWSRWLEVVGWYLVVFGIAFALFNQSPLFDALFNRHIDPIFWSEAQMPDAARQSQAWVYGVLGSTVAGWGVLVAFVARSAFRSRQRWSWTAFAVGITLWFVVDTWLSIAHGVYFNAAFNSVLALLIYIPLLATRAEFAEG